MLSRGVTDLQLRTVVPRGGEWGCGWRTGERARLHPCRWTFLGAGGKEPPLSALALVPVLPLALVLALVPVLSPHRRVEDHPTAAVSQPCETPSYPHLHYPHLSIQTQLLIAIHHHHRHRRHFLVLILVQLVLPL